MVDARIKIRSAFHLLVLIFSLIERGFASTVEYKVFCTPKEMTVTIVLPDSKTEVYVDKLKGYPDCKPRLEGNRATFHLSLEDIFTCGTTRVSDAKGGKLFYNRLVVEKSKTIKDKIKAKCEIHGRNLLTFRGRRDVLPEGFVEPENINITGTVIGNGVVPDLNVGVRQNGNYIDTQLNVQPGTPLEMEVYLDQNSSSTYGILVTSMNVTDKSPDLREIIIFKGCSIDPYLFSNFELQDDNRVVAKFRAFKFPESSYVLFIGSVSICIDLCQGIPCSNGQLGYGRRKRELSLSKEEIDFSRETYRDPNQIFEVTMTTILKVNESENQFSSNGFLGGAADADDAPSVVAIPDDDVTDTRFFEENKNEIGNWSEIQHLSKFLIAITFLLHVLRSIL